MEWLKNFGALIDTASKHFGITVAVFFMMFVLGGMTIIGMNAKEILAHFPTPAEEGARFKKVLHNNSMISAEMDDVRQNLNADRLVMRQYHNTVHDLTNLPFTSVSTMIVKVKSPEFELETSAYDSKPLLIYSDLMDKMWSQPKPHCARVDTRDLPNGIFKQRMTVHGTDVTYNCPIYTAEHGYPIGHISAAYVFGDDPKDRPSDDIILAKLKFTAAKIGDALESTVKP